MTYKTPSVIVFDLGNTIIPFDYSKLAKKLDAVEAGLGETFNDFYNKNYHHHREFESGKITNEQFIDIMLDALHHKIDADTFCCYFSSIFTVDEKVAGLLPVLKKNYMLVLLSNTNDIHMKYSWQHNDFIKYFDKLVLSHQVGAVKPDPKIYKAVEEFTKRPAADHLFIDDVHEYAEGARKLGWDAIDFKGYDNLVEELKLRKVL